MQLWHCMLMCMCMCVRERVHAFNLCFSVWGEEEEWHTAIVLETPEIYTSYNSHILDVCESMRSKLMPITKTV